jgi:hypothetical protein
MAENSISRVRTHHINTRYHFVCENLKDGLKNIVFVKTRINDADMLTKIV